MYIPFVYFGSQHTVSFIVQEPQGLQEDDILSVKILVNAIKVIYTNKITPSQGQQSPLKLSKAEGQHGEATEEDSVSDADDQQTPPSVTAMRQSWALKMRGPNLTRQ